MLTIAADQRYSAGTDRVDERLSTHVDREGVVGRCTLEHLDNIVGLARNSRQAFRSVYQTERVIADLEEILRIHTFNFVVLRRFGLSRKLIRTVITVVQVCGDRITGVGACLLEFIGNTFDVGSVLNSADGIDIELAADDGRHHLTIADLHGNDLIARTDRDFGERSVQCIVFCQDCGRYAVTTFLESEIERYAADRDIELAVFIVFGIDTGGSINVYQALVVIGCNNRDDRTANVNLIGIRLTTGGIGDLIIGAVYRLCELTDHADHAFAAIDRIDLIDEVAERDLTYTVRLEELRTIEAREPINACNLAVGAERDNRRAVADLDIVDVIDADGYRLGTPL